MSELEPQPLPDVSVDAYAQLIKPLDEARNELEAISQLYDEFTSVRGDLLRPVSEERADAKLHLMWGYPVEPVALESAIKKCMRDSLGDTVFLLMRTLRVKGLEPTEVLRDAVAMFEPVDVTAPIDFRSVDSALKDKMPPTTHPTYSPDYEKMSQNREEPFLLTGNGYVIRPDGYYALHASLLYLTSCIELPADDYCEVAAQAFTVISAVAQNRLGSSLQDIVNRNGLKLRFALRTKTQNNLSDIANQERNPVMLNARDRITGKFITALSPPSMN